MIWTHTETLALAKNSCSQCHGNGLKTGRGRTLAPCNCVLRAVFRACYERYRYCSTKEKYMSKVTLDRLPGKDRRLSWVRKDEDYICDFCLVSKRTLDEAHYKIFRLHFLLGADWRFCCRLLKIDRGTFFHSVYRIQQQLGRVFRELKPYGLYPVDEYFTSVVRKRLPLPLDDEPPRGPEPEVADAAPPIKAMALALALPLPEEEAVAA